MEVEDVLGVVAAVGPYFEVVSDPIGPTWLPLGALTGAVLDERVEHLRTMLASRTGVAAENFDRRACASTNFLGIMSRVLAPALGAVALTGTALVPGDVFWQRVDGGPIPVAWVNVTAHPVASAQAAADALLDGVVEPFVRPLASTYRHGCGLSPKVIWGNVASALAGAAGLLNRAGPTKLDPVAIVDTVLHRSSLAGMGEYVQPDPQRTERFFVRNNCCLFYRIPDGATCGDCVLVPRGEREVFWRELLDRSR